MFGIDNATALAPLVEIAFDPVYRAEHRISACRELLKYSEVPTRSIEYGGTKEEQTVNVTILGTCEIKRPALERRDDPERLAPTATSGSIVELHDERREEGS